MVKRIKLILVKTGYSANDAITGFYYFLVFCLITLNTNFGIAFILPNRFQSMIKR